jgi:peroxiredoxin Q/BCP
MKRSLITGGGRLAAVLLLGATLAAPAMAADGEDTMSDLQPGDITPSFSLVGSDGKTYNLADFKGDKPVVIAWFPKAFTGG